MKIWICIPVFNRKQLTLDCLATLKKQEFQNFTVVICDHGSTDGTSKAIEETYPDAILLRADSS
jgi:glycosyltransferase involved in cell wall biosynthesis